MTVIGIDPGNKGGIAVITDGKLETYKMPETYPDIFDLLSEIDLKDMSAKVYMEKVGQGMPGQSSKATATFARHCGHLEMALYALAMSTEQVTPQKWQKSYSNEIGSRDGDKKEWKNKLKLVAQRLYPTHKVTLWNADAILIAHYGEKIQGKD